MRDAIGGAWTLQLILIFLIVITCVLAFSVNYAKSFRLKDAVLDYLEEGQGLTKDVANKIESKRSSVGYGIDWKIDGDNWKCKNGICIKFNDVGKSNSSMRVKYCGTNNPDCTVGYYTVVTFIYVNVPIMSNILESLQTAQENGALNITGDTTTMKVINNDGWGA